MKGLVVATKNQGKLREIRGLLAGLDIQVTSLADYPDAPDIVEDGDTFAANALIKARIISAYTGKLTMGEDSGLEVKALENRPGIYSARYAGADATDDDNNRKLLALLKDVPESNRSARFQCLLVYLRHAKDPTPLICQGTWEGRIAFDTQGKNGFGYDPLFVVAEKNCRSAELMKDEKNAISHRGKAIQLLLNSLSTDQQVQQP